MATRPTTDRRRKKNLSLNHAQKTDPGEKMGRVKRDHAQPPPYGHDQDPGEGTDRTIPSYRLRPPEVMQQRVRPCGGPGDGRQRGRSDAHGTQLLPEKK